MRNQLCVEKEEINKVVCMMPEVVCVIGARTRDVEVQIFIMIKSLVQVIKKNVQST